MAELLPIADTLANKTTCERPRKLSLHLATKHRLRQQIVVREKRWQIKTIIIVKETFCDSSVPIKLWRVCSRRHFFAPIRLERERGGKLHGRSALFIYWMMMNGSALAGPCNYHPKTRDRYIDTRANFHFNDRSGPGAASRASCKWAGDKWAVITIQETLVW